MCEDYHRKYQRSIIFSKDITCGLVQPSNTAAVFSLEEPVLFIPEADQPG
jgi:hypothetical protein